MNALLRSWFQPVKEASWAMQRKVDMRVLWPVCKQMSVTMDEAKAAFAVHAMNDPCWIEYYGEEKLKEVISALN